MSAPLIVSRRPIKLRPSTAPVLPLIATSPRFRAWKARSEVFSRSRSSCAARPNETRVMESRGRCELTLITCYPFYFVGPAPRRFVVHARPLENETVVRIAVN